MIANKKSIQDFVKDVVYQTLEVTCYMFPVEADELEDMGVDTNVNEDDMTTSVVTFQGAAEGALFISANDDLYHALAANMLGESTANQDEKEAALCEIANIICGNIVPYFAMNDEICKINPPQMSNQKVRGNYQKGIYQNEYLRVFTDEGIVDISIYFNNSIR